MVYTLMNGDIPVLEFELDSYVKVLNNDFLPYELKDYIIDTDPTNFKKALSDFEVLKDYLSSRTLSLSRDNAKVILNIATLPQSLKTSDKLKIVFACKGLSMTDNYWIKENDEKLSFRDVNLRKTKLSEASYHIAILGKYISATATELRPDLVTNGMFPKYWKRNGFSVELWKTDKLTNHNNTFNEVIVSDLLGKLGVESVTYSLKYQDEIPFAVSECIADDEYSLVAAQSVKDWCEHTGKDFMKYICDNYLTEFANMCVADYIIANPDRHFGNWGFIIDNKTNKILKFAPLFDHNQALISDMVGADIDELIYEPTGLTFIETVFEYVEYSNVTLDINDVSEKVRERLQKVVSAKERYSNIDVV